MTSSSVPVVGCVVKVGEDDAAWLVESIDEERSGEPWLRLVSRSGSAPPRAVPASSARTGLVTRTKVSERGEGGRGEGMVQQLRTLGGREQVLVMFDETGELVWVPHERLSWVRTAASEFARGERVEGQAERLRMRLLASMLRRWDENTGALGRLEIDPLPHQLHLVHHILSSGHNRWLIADDVGLGKTIEVGMLLSALGRREGFERVLIVTPSGLTRQWQEEMSEKFGLPFEIYGRDFMVHEPNGWTVRERVIASIDRIKHENHAPNLLGSRRRWDLVIFDEAHRLTRKEKGSKQESSQRYAIARELGKRADDVLLLTATPHQGKADRFHALLELLRPEWSQRLRALDEEPELLGEMIYRNRKADVTDAQGRFVFAGQSTHRIEIESSPDERTFDDELQRYFTEGYAQAKRLGRKGAAIGFVMTTFRKLAASSHAAILSALGRRLEALVREEADGAVQEGEVEWDARFAGELEEARLEQAPRKEFFGGEIERLESLLASAAELLSEDTKMRTFLEDVVEQASEGDAGRKVLIFTEFKNTQAALARGLEARFGAGSVGLINGDVKLEDRREVVAAFNSEDGHRFVVSTEAGGEGLNMHHRCHTLVNYDLPWNPMRLVQRVGRVYRYGQEHRVVVFNLHQPDTLDGRVVGLIYERLEAVSRDLANVSDEYGERLRDEILGELAEAVDVKVLLEEASRRREERPEERVDAAMARARDTQRMQSELLSGAVGFDPGALEDQVRLGREHVEAFVEGMLEQEGLEVVERTHGGAVWRVTIHDALRSALGVKAQTLRVSASREHGRLEGVRPLDFDEPLFAWLADRASSRDFGGRSAFAKGAPKAQGVCAALLRWQDAWGRARREEVVVLTRGPGGTAQAPEWLSGWLLEPGRDLAAAALGETVRKNLAASFYGQLDDALAKGSNRYLHPMQMAPMAFAWFET